MELLVIRMQISGHFISCMGKENATMHYKIAQDVAGVAAVPQKRTYRHVNTQVSTIVRDYRNRNIINYLRALSHPIALNTRYFRFQGNNFSTSLYILYPCLRTFTCCLVFI